MSLFYKTVIFIVLSVGLVLLFRASLFNARSHGFYRFFAFESILILVLLNLDYWFYSPSSFRQIISWVLLISCLFPLLTGALSLQRMGKPGNARSDLSLIGIEKTTKLVTKGIYQYIRHPIYSSLLLGSWGVFLKHLSWVGFGLALVTTILITVTAKIEEAENIGYFGSAYRDYMKNTKMFIPYLF